MFDTGDMARAALAAELVEQIRPVTLARERRLPVVPALDDLIPGGGLRCGSTLATDGPAATSLALAAVAAASQDGAWVAAVGFPSLGLLAAAEAGIALERFVLVASPETEAGPDNEETAWAAAIAALVDAFEVVLVQATHRVRNRDGRRLAARTRERGSVLVQVGSGGWSERADVTLEVTDSRWEGLADGHGHLRARRVTVVGGGRREASRPRRSELWLPSVDGLVEVVTPDPVPLRADDAVSA